MNNTVYGKTMENLRNRIDIKLVSDKKDYLKWTSKQSYMSHKIFENDLVATCKNKAHKPAHIGVHIRIKKILMYEFHYDYIKNKYGNNPKLLFTGNDSLMYEI